MSKTNSINPHKITILEQKQISPATNYEEPHKYRTQTAPEESHSHNHITK